MADYISKYTGTQIDSAVESFLNGGSSGFSPIVTVDEINGGHRVTIQDANKTQSFEVMDGDDGVGIAKIEQTTTSNADGGINIITVTMTDGKTSTFQVKNGSKGSEGSGGSGGTGENGKDGVGIQSVVQTTTSNTDGGTNVVTVTLTDGSKSTFNVKNGSKGSAGFSPNVTILPINGGNQVMIQDANGYHSFNVMDGKDGDAASVKIDNTLKVSGAAADAKATGDKIETVDTKLMSIAETVSASFQNVQDFMDQAGTLHGLLNSLKYKSFLVIGDSLSEANEWQKQLQAWGAEYTNHAKGGVGLLGMVTGTDGFAALTVDEVSGKDGIILFGGTNNMREPHGSADNLGTQTVVTSLNKLDHSKFEYGILSGGVLNGDEAYTTSDYMPFVAGEKLYLYVRTNSTGAVNLNTMEVGDGVAIHFFDSNKNLISTDSASAYDSNTMPNPYTVSEPNTAYIRFRYKSDYIRNPNRHNGIFKQAVDATTFDEYSETVVSGTDTVAGCMQTAIDRIYELLAEANNLTCRLMVVTPFCFGASDYNEDAFAMNGSGLAQVIEDVANYNGVPVYNAYKNSGINPTTLKVWGNSVSDHLHLNAAGYAHLGKRIAYFANANMME